MSRFYADITGGRGTATRQGHAASGIRGHVRGWNVGIQIVGHVDTQGDDAFGVWLTRGSSDARGPQYIGTVKLVDDVPTFLPSPVGPLRCSSEQTLLPDA